MAGSIDVLVLGTGSFAARIVFDLAATASAPLRVAVGGRNAERLSWLTIAGNARAVIFGSPVTFASREIDLTSADAAAALIAQDRPRVVVQAASAQPAAVIATKGDAWSRLVDEGGLSATAIFQALLSTRVARAVAREHPSAQLVNCCFPDVVNSMIAAAGLPVACGVGNIAILANAFAGILEPRRAERLKVLASYQTITPFRRPAASRGGPMPRVWLDGAEVADVAARFAAVKITPEPAVEISGASGVPLIAAMATGGTWTGHVPGPGGLPGGYPVAWRDGRLDLDLPPGLGRDEAVAWNARFEAENGVAVGGDGRVRYTGRLHERLRGAAPSLAEGFPIGELETVYDEMAALRARLRTTPA